MPGGIAQDARGRRLTLAVVALAALVVYLNSLANGFAYDDVWIIQRRELVHGLARLPELLLAEYWPERLGAGLYRPLTLLTYAVDWTIWGGAPLGFHLGNVLLHAGVSGLVTALLLRFFPWWAALAGGLIFAVHPVHTEAVANVVGRAELLAAAAILTAALVYVRASGRERIGTGTVALVGGLYVLAMLSKESGVLLPALLLTLDLPLRRDRAWPGVRDYLRRRAPLFLTLALLLLVYLGVRWAVLDTVMGVPPDRAFAPDDSFPTRLFTMARVWPRYYELLLFPTQLSADYSPAVILPAAGLTLMGGVGFLLVGATIVLGVLAIRGAPELTAAVGWACVAMLPVSNVIFPGQFLLAERTLYLPSVAVSIVVAVLLIRASRATRKVLVFGLAAWVLGFSIVTVRRNPVWETTHTVWEDVRRNHPESSKLVWSIGEQHLRKGEWREAKRMFRRSLRLWPYHAPYLVEYATYLLKRAELAEAEQVAARAVELRPDHADHHTLLALIRLRKADAASAIRAVERGLRAAGEDPFLYAVRADAETELGNHVGAAEAQERAVQVAGDEIDSGVWLRLARFRAAAGDTVGALVAIRVARRGQGDASVLDSLQLTLERGRNETGGRGQVGDEDRGRGARR